MSDYNRYDDQERRWRSRENREDFDDEMRDEAQDWSRDRNRDYERNRRRQERGGLDRTVNILGSRYGENYPRTNVDEEQFRGSRFDRDTRRDPNREYNRPQEYERGRGYYRGQDFGQRRDFDRDRFRDEERYGGQRRSQYARVYETERMQTDNENYDYDFDTGYDRRFRDRSGDQSGDRFSDRDQHLRQRRFENQERGYGRGSEGGWQGQRQTRDYYSGQQRGWQQGQDYGSDFDRNYGLGEDFDDESREHYGYGRDYRRSQVSYGQAGDNYDWGRDREQRRRFRSDQYGTAGMRSDYEGRLRRQRSAGMRSDVDQERGYRSDFSDQDFENTRGYVGYESEGAFYQDLDEPYSYDYWEAWMVPGDFTGMGPANYTRSDERIHETVCERLTRHGRIDASEIEIDVKDGEVTLTGSVPAREMKRLAEDTADGVTGVKNVRNELKVHKQEQQQRDRSWSERNMELGASEATMGRSTYTGAGPASTSGPTAQSTAAGSTQYTGGMESSGMGDDKRRQLREGMEVLGKNGKVVGRVKEIRDRDFLVDRDMARDVYIPYEAVNSVGASALLAVEDAEVDNQNWEKPNIL